MAAVLQLALLMAASAPVLATECLMIGKVYEEASKQKQENVHKWEDCARSCNQTDGCSLFTYQPESVFKSNCWLIKDSATAIMTDDPYSISGSKACLATRPTSLVPCPEPGVFFEDKILPDPHLWTSTWQDCQAKCASHETCRYFSWKEDTSPTGGCWMLPSHNFTRFHQDRYAISGQDQCPWKKLSDSDKLEAEIGDPGTVILDCRAQRTLYKDLRLPSPKMYLEKWEDCQVACDDSDDCEAYSYKKDTSPPGGCWLFRTLKYGTRIPDDEAVTGRKWCQIPPSLEAQAPEVQSPTAPVSVSPTGSSGGSYFWLMLCAFALALLCCFGLLCFAFLKRKSPKTRAAEIESDTAEEEVPVLAAAPPPAPPAPAAPAAPPVLQLAPRPMPAAVTYYRVKPMSSTPVILEASEPVATGV